MKPQFVLTLVLSLATVSAQTAGSISLALSAGTGAPSAADTMMTTYASSDVQENLSLELKADVSTPAPSANPFVPRPVEEVGDNGSPQEAFPLQNCQGDCDFDKDCDEGLYCVQRDNSNDPVPGCLDWDTSSRDYCAPLSLQPPQEDVLPGAFRLRLYWHENSNWQDETTESWWCATFDENRRALRKRTLRGARGGRRLKEFVTNLDNDDNVDNGQPDDNGGGNTADKTNDNTDDNDNDDGIDEVDQNGNKNNNVDDKNNADNNDDDKDNDDKNNDDDTTDDSIIDNTVQKDNNDGTDGTDDDWIEAKQMQGGQEMYITECKRAPGKHIDRSQSFVFIGVEANFTSLPAGVNLDESTLAQQRQVAMHQEVLVQLGTGEDLCWERWRRAIFLEPCDKTNPLQRWYAPNGNFNGDKFEISQDGYDTQCVSNDHHPTDKEVLEMHSCVALRKWDSETSFWERY